GTPPTLPRPGAGRGGEGLRAVELPDLLQGGRRFQARDRRTACGYEEADGAQHPDGTRADQVKKDVACSHGGHLQYCTVRYSLLTLDGRVNPLFASLTSDVQSA